MIFGQNRPFDPSEVQLVSRKPSFGPFSYEEQMNLDTKVRFQIDAVTDL